MKLNKETTIATIIGFFLGLSVAASIFLLPDYVKSRRSTTLPPVLDEGKIAPQQKEPLLSIIVPDNEAILKEEKVILIGRSKPGSLIVINSLTQDHVLKTDPSGQFEKEIELSPASQELVITAYTSDGQSETVRRLISYYP